MHASKLSFMRPALIAGLGLAAIAGATGASAQDARTEAVAIEVRYGDLDLSADNDVERLHTRVRSAARQICAYNGMLGAGANRMRQDCLDSTLEKANRDVAVAIAEHGNQRYASRKTIGVGTR